MFVYDFLTYLTTEQAQLDYCNNESYKSVKLNFSFDEIMRAVLIKMSKTLLS